MLYNKLIIISVVLGLSGLIPTSELVTASNQAQDFRQETLNPNVTDALSVNDSQDFRQETLNPNVTDALSVNDSQDFRQETLNPNVTDY